MEQAGVTNDDVAHRCKVVTEVVEAWRKGGIQPSKTQFKGLIALLRRPTAFFFLPEPPTEPAVPAAFRRPSGDGEQRGLLQVDAKSLRSARRLQRVSRWIMGLDSAPRINIPETTINDSPDEAASQARSILGWSTHEQYQARDASAVARLFRQRLENSGFLVLNLPLTKDGCRGFSLYDTHAPLIAINTYYNVTARLYTYGHELGHLMLRSDSICTYNQVYGIERWCERFAAAFFMPREAVIELIRTKLFGRVADLVDSAQRLASRFKVSLRAAAIRLIDLGYAKQDEYNYLPFSDYKRPGGSGGGETSPERRLREWGSTYPRLLFDAESRDVLTREDVLGYLNLSNSQLVEYRELLNVGPPFMADG
jgi:Zn-dependent peptidase ImmA (M78 family)